MIGVKNTATSPKPNRISATRGVRRSRRPPTEASHSHATSISSV